MLQRLEWPEEDGSGSDICIDRFCSLSESSSSRLIDENAHASQIGSECLSLLLLGVVVGEEAEGRTASMFCVLKHGNALT